MEPERFKIKTIIILAMFSLFLLAGEMQAGWLQARPGLPYYNVDREITIEGQIEDIRFEQRYEKRASFLILQVKDKNSGEIYEVETAPAWFFQVDFHQGEKNQADWFSGRS